MVIDVLNFISRKRSIEDKNNKEKLKKLIDQLSMLSEKYRYVTSRMENLIKNNSIFPQQNFGLRIQSLIIERDEILEEISMKRLSKKTLESLINISKVQTNAIINELNRVLDIQISDIDRNKYSNRKEKNSSAIGTRTNNLFTKIRSIVF